MSCILIFTVIWNITACGLQIKENEFLWCLEQQLCIAVVLTENASLSVAARNITFMKLTMHSYPL